MPERKQVARRCCRGSRPSAAQRAPSDRNGTAQSPTARHPPTSSPTAAPNSSDRCDTVPSSRRLRSDTKCAHIRNRCPNCRIRQGHARRPSTGSTGLHCAIPNGHCDGRVKQPTIRNRRSNCWHSWHCDQSARRCHRAPRCRRD